MSSGSYYEEEMSSGGHRRLTAFILWPFSPSKKSPLDPPSPWSWLGAYVHKESASAQIPDDLPREERIIDRSSCFFPAATPGFGDAAQLSSPTQKNSCRPTSHGSRACRLRRGGVGTAGGDVAHAALFDIRCPGAPVEIGFSSNAAEERNLGSAAYILI